MNHLRQLGDRISISIEAGEDGLTGRECPNSDCEGYFKIEFGTGLDGENLPCHCPYCGHTDPHDHFWTQEQIKYARSVAMRKISDAVRRDLKGLEFDIKPKGPFGIGLSMKLRPGPRLSIHRYREPKLETDIVCADCTLRYSVYGVFAFCPDCGQHNSLQILEKNMDLVRKVLDLAEDTPELSERLIENALEDCVSAFDGFGRELCRVNAEKASTLEAATQLSFQSLPVARDKVLERFGFDLAKVVSQTAWKEAVTLFQKRHLVAHKMGVVDQHYVSRSGDSDAVVGRKIAVGREEVCRLADSIGVMARALSRFF